ILQQYSTLLPCEENPVENINHIKVEHTKANYSLALIDSILMGISDCADACVAHNAEFDKKFVALVRCGTHLINKKWVCTKQNFTLPIALPRFRLEDICTAMRVPYVNAHRALNDCALLAQCFQNVEDLQDRFDRLR